MNKKRIIDEIREVRESNANRFEQQKKLEEGIEIIEKKLNDNLEMVISYLKEDLVRKASYGDYICVEEYSANIFELSSELNFMLDLGKIKDITTMQKLFEMYSIKSRNGEFLSMMYGQVVRKSALFDRIQDEGLNVTESVDLDNSIRLVVFESLEDFNKMKLTKN